MSPACVNACPTHALMFGNIDDAESTISQEIDDATRRRPVSAPAGRGYKVLENLGTNPNVVYLKKVDKAAEEHNVHG